MTSTDQGFQFSLSLSRSGGGEEGRDLGNVAFPLLNIWHGVRSCYLIGLMFGIFEGFNGGLASTVNVNTWTFTQAA